MITDIRLAGHQLVTPEFDRPGDLVEWMGALQAQDYRMAKWAIGVRLRTAGLGSINEALEKGEIVRTHVMRPTWHFVAGKDIRWMQKLTALRVKKNLDSWTKGCGVDITEEQYVKSNDLIAKILSGRRYLTREEIETELERSGMTVAGNRTKRYILRAEVEGIVCSGADREGKPTYALLDEHVAPATELSKEESLVKLALAYFRSHSPATLNDFVWWSGLTVKEAKQAISIAGKELVTENFHSCEFLIHHSCRKAKREEIVHFLPPYDEYLISYKDRTAVMAEEHYSKAFNNWGIFYPVLLHQGRIVGNWKKTIKKGETVLSTSFFDSGQPIGQSALKEAEKRFSDFWKS